MPRRLRGPLRAVIVLAVGVCVCGPLSASALAQPGWMMTGHSSPTAMPPGGSSTIVLDVMNVGDSASSGQITVTDTLPEGVTAEEAGTLGSIGFGEQPGLPINQGDWQCTGNGPGGVSGARVVRCTSELSYEGGGGFPGSPRGEHPAPGIALKVKLPAAKSPGEVVTKTNSATISGGGASEPASTSDKLTITEKELGFGIQGWDAWASNADGTIDTQAGSHPYEITFVTSLNNAHNESGWYEAGVGGKYGGPEARDYVAKLPPGFVGEPNAIPRCTRQQLDAHECPAGSQLGVLTLMAAGGIVQDGEEPIFNMVAPTGYPDEIGYLFSEGSEAIETRFDTEVRSGSDYGLTTHFSNVPEQGIIESIVTLWGEPGSPSHNPWRGRIGDLFGGGCGNGPGRGACQTVSGEEKPFFTLPTSCSPEPIKFTVEANTWQSLAYTAKATSTFHDANGVPTSLTGCEHLTFGPTVTTDPDTSRADTPAGLTVEVKAPVNGLQVPGGLSSADLQNTTVALPRGVAINPGQAAGLAACGPGEDGLTPRQEESLPEEPHASEDNGPPSCPSASKVGTDEIVTPDLVKPLQGSVYVLKSEPPELKLLVAASGEGVNVKLVGVVHLNESTGQLTTTFAGTPALPFTNFRLSFSGGAQAALATPTQCGVYGPEQGFSADFESWASPTLGNVFPTAAFAITSGTNGAPCPPSPLPYTPQLDAGSTTDQAGGYTDFSLLLQVPDDQQRTTRLQFKTPEGLLGMISKVPLCTNAQAEANACPEASQIGHTVVASGPGPYPLVVPQPGQQPAPIYLTEGYEGAPYGLSIVVPLHVGPFVLPTQRVRARIEVDELTSQLTVTTSALPQYVAGVPTDLRSIDAVIDRPGFMFNPTGCTKRPFSGTAYGIEGASAPISSPFQMGSCRALLFQPNFKVSTSGKTSRANGASLDAKIVYPTGNLGANQASSQSNIASVKVDLPKQLPSRLTTLQKACTAAQFNSNPAGCPAASVVGHATAVTPVLPVALNGPAYFVSNGGEAFPNLIVVLQGYGVTIHLIGDTFISKAGVTSSTFKQVPDVPIASFDLNLPEGKYSALAANGNLCTSKLAMPTEFVGQNGAEIKQSTPITVEGCSTAISIVSHKVKGRTLTVSVSVPAAGRVTASGKGLSSSSKSAKARETLTFKLTQKKAGKLKTTVAVSFTPSTGKDRKKQAKSARVTFEK
jgi:hypothetical protein